MVVVDTVEQIARHISVQNGRLFYKARPVISAGNTNILPALVRNGTIDRLGPEYLVDTSVFHDGPLAPLIHDKGVQQDLAIGTGISPMRWRENQSSDELIETILDFLRDGLPVVVKPNAASGGAGIELFGPGTAVDTIRVTIERMLGEVGAKYGAHSEKSVWPVRVFEFVESTPYPVGTFGHLWDMRVACLIRPGEVEITFCGLRVCPEPFSPGHYTRASSCSNTSGRRPSIERIRSPLADKGTLTDHLRAAGFDEALFFKAVDASAKWCDAAWNRYAIQDRNEAGELEPAAPVQVTNNPFLKAN